MSSCLKQVSDAELLRALLHTVRNSRRCLVELLQQLNEIEKRRLHLLCGHSSLFSFRISLNFSEGEAYKRIAVARAAVAFPIILQHLASGNLHLTGAALLAPHLTTTNAERLLDDARGKSKKYILAMLAALKPSAPLGADLRRLGGVYAPVTSAPAIARPTSAAKSGTPCPGAAALAGAALPISRAVVTATAASCGSAGSSASRTAAASSVNITPASPNLAVAANAPTAPVAAGQGAVLSPCAPGAERSGPAAVLEPTAAAMYRLRVNLNQVSHDQLLNVQGMLRHTLPDGDLNAIIALALDELAAKLRQRKYGLLKDQATSREKSHRLSLNARALSVANPPALTPVSTPRSAGASSPLPSSASALPSTSAQPSVSIPVNKSRGADAPLLAWVPAGVNAASAVPVTDSALPSAGATLFVSPCGDAPNSGARSTRRAIPRAVKRAVYLRDNGCCSFIASDGRACKSTGFLEFDHVVPYALGGVDSVENLRLRCRAHNVLAAEAIFGSFVGEYKRSARAQFKPTSNNKGRAPA